MRIIQNENNACLLPVLRNSYTASNKDANLIE